MTEPADPTFDQYRAAADDAEAEFYKATADDSEYEVPGGAGQVVEQVYREFMDRVASEHGRVCRHASGRGPHVIHGAACNPGIVGCAKCIRELRDLWTAKEMAEGDGRTCDGCKKKALYGKSGIVQRGPLLLHIALCEFCCTIDDATRGDE